LTTPGEVIQLELAADLLAAGFFGPNTPGSTVKNATPSAFASYAALIGAMILWSSAFIATKAAYAVFHPLTLMAGRMVVGAAFMLVFFPRLRGSRYERGDWRWLLLLGLSEPCLYFVFEAYAIRYTTASQAGMVTAMLPLMVAVGAALTLKERLSRRMVLGFLVAIAGVAWLTAAGTPEENAPNPVLGNLLEVCAMACATGYMIIARHLAVRYTAWFLTAVQVFAGTLFFLPMQLLPGVDLPERFDFWPVAAVVYLGLGATLLACGFYSFSVRRLPASVASGYVNLIPVFTVLMGWLILGEAFTPAQMAASILVFAGVFLSRERKRDN
jgi:drug/metabolite transporter (DMT)-like permease